MEGALEKKVSKKTIVASENNQTKIYTLVHQNNMYCGRTIDIYIDPVIKKTVPIGAKHTGQAISKLVEVKYTQYK